MEAVEQPRIPSVQEVIGKALANPHSALSKEMAARTAANPAPKQPETQEGIVGRLESELAALRQKIRAGSDATAAGDSETTRQYDLEALASEVRAALERLDQARADLAAAERAAKDARRLECEQEFAENIELAFSARAEFQKGFAIAAVALGDYYRVIRKLANLDREQRADSFYFLRDPAQNQELADVGDLARLSPINDLLSRGYRHDMDVQTTSTISIPALISPAKRSNENER